jgi:hypothetical protein
MVIELSGVQFGLTNQIARTTIGFKVTIIKLKRTIKQTLNNLPSLYHL